MPGHGIQSRIFLPGEKSKDMPATKFRTKVSALSGFEYDEPFTAALDLSAKQYYFVAAGSIVGEVIGATGASNPTPLGVLQNAPAAAGEARVRVLGKTSLTGSPASCNLGYGRFISSGSAGQGLASLDSACNVLGRWLSASLVSTGGSILGTAFINCTGFSGCRIEAS